VVNFEQTATVKGALVSAGVDNAHASVWNENQTSFDNAIKHQLRKMMFDDLVKQAENAEKAQKAKKAEKAAVIARTEQFAIIERNKSTLATGAIGCP
jgi:flagellin-specific chaperone FliS